jgi:predicted nucleotidyltransferase
MRAMPRTLEEITCELRGMLPGLRERYPISYLGVFGSWAREEQRPGSDLDLLVDFDGPIDLFAYARLQREIADRIGVPVDLVHRPGLKPAIGRNVLREVQPV